MELLETETGWIEVPVVAAYLGVESLKTVLFKAARCNRLWWELVGGSFLLSVLSPV